MAGRRWTVAAWGYRHWRSTFAICGALCAAILGAAVQDVLDTNLRLAAAAVTVLCLVVVALSAGLSVIVESRWSTNNEIVGVIREEMAGHRKVAAVMDARVASLAREISVLANSIGIKVDTMLLDELNTAKSIEGDRTVQLMLGAKKEVLILDFLLEDGRWPDEAMDQSYQNNAFRAFRELLSQQDKSILYRRVIQVCDPSSSLRQALTPSLIRHCHDIIKLRQNGVDASLRVTRRRFPFKFIIIDRIAVVLQLQQYGADGELLIWGEVLISDPEGQLVAVFRKIWEEFVEDPSTRTVTLADLPPLGLHATE